MSNHDIKSRIGEGLEALSDSAKWAEYRKGKIRDVAGRFDIKTCEAFADYLNTVMIAVINAHKGNEVYKTWRTKDKTEKKQFAQDIVNTFIDYIISDIWNDRVTMYNSDGTLYRKEKIRTRQENDYFDRLYKEDITHKPNVVVTDFPDGLMGVAPTGELIINFDHMFYKSLVVFLMDLRHELDHIVNMFFPNIHPLALLGSDRLAAMRYYVQPHEDGDLYADNPVEISANLKRGEFAEMCSLAVAGKPWNEPRNVNSPKEIEH